MVNQALGIDHAAFELIRKAEAEIQLKNVSRNVILSQLLSRTEKLEIIKYTAFFLFLVVYINRAIIFILIWSVKTLRAP